MGDLIRTATELEQITEKHKAELRDGLTYDQLVEVAAELGISEDALVRAVMDRNAPHRASAVKDVSKRKKAREIFVTHLWTYGSVIAGLFVIDQADGGVEWVYYPAAGWGMMVLIHARAIFTR